MARGPAGLGGDGADSAARAGPDSGAGVAAESAAEVGAESSAWVGAESAAWVAAESATGVRTGSAAGAGAESRAGVWAESGAGDRAGLAWRARFRMMVRTLRIITPAKRMPAAFQATAAQPLEMLIIVAARRTRASWMPTRTNWGRWAGERKNASTPASSSFAMNRTKPRRSRR